MAIQRMVGRHTLKSQQAPAKMIDRYTCKTADEAHPLKPQNQTIHIIKGSAWLSFQGKDHVLRAGDAFSLHKDPYVAVISALGNTPLVYELVQAA